jgi:hypothetical protein
VVFIAYCLAVLLFCLAFYYTRLLATCSQVIVVAQQAITTITDKNTDDEAKEEAAKAAAVSILKNSFILIFKIVITLGAAVLPLSLANITGLANFSETSEFALRLDVLLITTVIVSAAVFLGRKLLGKK